MTPIQAGGPIGGALEITQLANYAELVETATTSAENLKYTFEQYRMMYENFRNLPNQIRQQAEADLQELANIVQTGLSLAYSSAQIDEEYRNRHRDFSYYENLSRGAGGERKHQFFSDHYRDWSQSNHDSIRGALRAAGLQAQQFRREETAVRAIENQMQTASGTKQLLQAGGSIAALQVEQLQKLRQLQMAQIQLQTVQASAVIDKSSEEDADLQRALTPQRNLNENRSGGLKITDAIR